MPLRAQVMADLLTGGTLWVCLSLFRAERTPHRKAVDTLESDKLAPGLLGVKDFREPLETASMAKDGRNSWNMRGKPSKFRSFPCKAARQFDPANRAPLATLTR